MTEIISRPPPPVVLSEPLPVVSMLRNAAGELPTERPKFLVARATIDRVASAYDRTALSFKVPPPAIPLPSPLSHLKVPPSANVDFHSIALDTADARRATASTCSSRTRMGCGRVLWLAATARRVLCPAFIPLPPPLYVVSLTTACRSPLTSLIGQEGFFPFTLVELLDCAEYDEDIASMQIQFNIQMDAIYGTN